MPRFALDTGSAEAMATALAGLIAADNGPSDEQVSLVEGYGRALGVGQGELASVRAQIGDNAAAATADFVRRFDQYVDELSEFEFTHPVDGRTDEIALGAFKLAMNDSEANWMASMANVLIHEAGLIKHGTSEQFVPFGGVPYPGPDGQFGALSLPGAADLVAEAFARGAVCTSDFSRADHLSLAHLPLAEVREHCHVVPLAVSMRPDEQPGLWSASR